VCLGLAVVLMVGLEFLIHRTRVGQAMRAVSFNHKNAALMGINVDRTISITFVIGAVLAGAAGVLYAQKYGVLQQPAFNTWVLLGLKAFVAAVVGGIGNVRGAMLGGLLIGLLEQFGAYYISPDLRDVYVFGLLIVVLLVRPSGLLGRTTVEKV
jgi:branched-chain amino acid transport system permease protein